MSNRPKINKKCTRMTAATLRGVRLEIGFDMRSMARVLDRMPYRTYQDYEYGNRRIPQHVADAVRKVQMRNRKFMAALPGWIQAEVDRTHPAGIPSAAIREEK